MKETNSMRKLLYVPMTLAIAAAIPLLAPTIASSQDTPATAVTVPAEWLSIADIATLLADSGWTVVEIEAEIDEGKYEACLIGADGGEVEADIDPVTGEITSQEPESCGDEDGEGEDEHDDDADADEDADDTAGADAAGGADD